MSNATVMSNLVRTAKYLTKDVLACLGAIALSAIAPAVWANSSYNPSNLDQLTVPRGDVSNVTAVSYFGQTSVSGTLNVNANLHLCTNAANAAETVELKIGPDSGDTGIVKVAGGKSISNNHSAQTPADGFLLNALFGSNGGSGTLDLSADGSSFWGGNIEFCANAAASEIVLGKNSYLRLKTITQQSASGTAKIIFNGAGAYITPRNWGAVILSAPTAGSRLELTSTNGSPIRISSGDQDYKISNASDLGTLAFTGGVDVHITQGYFSDQNRKYVYFNSNRIAWEKIGDLYLDNGGLHRGGGIYYLKADNVLPYGRNVGIVRLITTGDQAGNSARQSMLDLCGYSQKLNGLVVENGIVANSSSKTEKRLTFGTDDADGILSGNLSGLNVVCEKTGAGELVVSNATVGTFVATNGIVTVPAGTIFSGDTLAATGVTFRVSGTLNFTHYAIAEDVDQKFAYTPATNAVITAWPTILPGRALLKDGLDYLTCVPPADAQNASLDIRGGTLRFGGAGVTDKYWRWRICETEGGARTVTETKGPFAGTTASATCAIGHLGLFAADGRNMAGLVVSMAADGTAANKLSAKYIASIKAFMPANNNSSSPYYRPSMTGGAALDNPANITKDPDSATISRYDTARHACYWGGLVFTNAMPVRATESTWQGIVFRLTDNAAPVYCYNVIPCVNVGSSQIDATAWRLESSATGEDGSWVIRDERMGEAVPDDTAHYSYNGHIPYLFTNDTSRSSWSFNTFGTVSVAAGATLDVSDIPSENVGLTALAVDVTAGAGSIVGAVPAATGTLALRNVPAALLCNGVLVAHMATGLKLPQASETERFAVWTVTIEGVSAPTSHPVVRNGELWVDTPHGMLIMLR